MSSISRRRNGLMALSVIGAPVLGEVFAPRSQDRTPASATPRDPSLATDYRGSGLVHRRISLVVAHSCDRLLSEPTAGTQYGRREPLLMPPLRALPRAGPRMARGFYSDHYCFGQNGGNAEEIRPVLLRFANSSNHSAASSSVTLCRLTTKTLMSCAAQ